MFHSLQIKTSIGKVGKVSIQFLGRKCCIWTKQKCILFIYLCIFLQKWLVATLPYCETRTKLSHSLNLLFIKNYIQTQVKYIHFSFLHYCQKYTLQHEQHQSLTFIHLTHTVMLTHNAGILLLIYYELDYDGKICSVF